MASTLDTTLTYLRRLCSAREYCSHDMMQKAQRRLEDEESAAKAVDTLIKEGFLSDSRYATAFARDKSSISGWGPVKISYALASKGISKDTIAEALEGIDVDKASDKLRKILTTKSKMLQGDPCIKIKLLKFALARGYGYEAANKVVSEILHGKNEDLQASD